MNNPPLLFKERKCSRCKKTKLIEEFSKRKAGKWRRENYVPHCKICERNRKTLYMRKYRKENPEKTKKIHREWRIKHPDRVRNMNLRKSYGIGLKDFDAMLIAQNYMCKICSTKHTPHTRETRLNVDHCHKRGHVRALLCHNCNKGLGHFKDDSKLLQLAADYLHSNS